MWDFIFQETNLHSKLLAKILSYEKNNRLLKYIQKNEKSIVQMNIDDILNILEFYESIETNNAKIRYENVDETKILDTIFVNEYDKWARVHGYEPLKKVTKLGEILSKVLKKDMKPKNIKVRQRGTSPTTPYNKIVYGIPFNKEEIYIRLGITEYNKEMYNKIIEIFEDNNTNKLERNNITQRLALDYQEKEINKNVSLMILHSKFTESFNEEKKFLEKI